MMIIAIYVLMALLLLALALGIYRPKRWQDLPEKTTIILRFGCGFGCAVIVYKLIGKFMS